MLLNEVNQCTFCKWGDVLRGSGIDSVASIFVQPKPDEDKETTDLTDLLTKPFHHHLLFEKE